MKDLMLTILLATMIDAAIVGLVALIMKGVLL